MSLGEQMIDLVHIDDVMRAYTLAADGLREQIVDHTHYAVASGKPMRLIDLVSEFKTATNTNLPITFGERPYRQREVMIPWNNYKIVPNWSADISFKKGVCGTFPSLLKRD